MMRARWLLLFVFSLSVACGTGRDQQLERVAKDWCLTIRASQVIPVYPLTEDLQPGDLFLVTETIDEQHRRYQEEGFLALDNHVARLAPRGYENFYARSFAPDPPELPKTWLAPEEEQWSWNGAPAAAFPSYSFATTKSGGLSLER